MSLIDIMIKHSTIHFAKQIVFWIIILLLAYFIFSGGLTSVYNNVKSNIVSSVAENQYEENSNLVKLIQKDGCYYIERVTKYQRDMVRESMCAKSVCMLENLFYYSHSCEGRDLVCYCEI